MVTDLGKGTLIADSPEEAVWWHQAEQCKEYIKQLKGSIRKAQADMKLSAREVHQKFIAGARTNMQQKKLTLKVQKEFLKFCETKIKPLVPNN